MNRDDNTRAVGEPPAIAAPLGATLEMNWNAFDRLFLQRGTELQKKDCGDGKPVWSGIGPRGLRTVTLREVIDGSGGRPILLGAFAADELRWFIASRVSAPALEITWQNLYNESFLLADPCTRPAFNTVYINGAVLYHCRALGQLYSALLHRFFLRNSSMENASDRIVLGGEVETYYEVEALITAAVRSYETARYLLWAAFGKADGTPRNFEGVLDRVSLPRQLRSASDRWLARYVKAKAYRDCIQHNAHFGARLPFALAVREQELWGVLVRLPDNPETKSYDNFTYSAPVDALSYGWELANEVIEMTQMLFAHVDRKD